MVGEYAGLRAYLVFAALLVAAITAPGRLTAGLRWNDANSGDDFGIFYDSATCLFLTGCAPYELGAGRAPNLNAPHTHLLFAPLVSLPRTAAYRTWLVLGTLSIVVSTVRVARAVPIRLSWRTWTIVAVGVLSSGLVSATVRTGQVYPMLAWPLTEAYLALRTSRWRTAAAVIAVLATMKPLLLLPLAWVTWRDRHAIPVALAAGAVTLIIGSIVFGGRAYLDWYESLSRFALSGHWWDGSILQSLTRTLRGTPNFAPLTIAPEAVRPLWLLLTLWLLVDLRRWIGRASMDAAWLGVLAATLLIAPKGWLYMAWLLIGPVGVVAHQASRPGRWWLIAFLLLLPDTTPLVGQPNRWLTPLLGSLYCWTWWSMYLAARTATHGVCREVR
jgi:hypothetical protein